MNVQIAEVHENADPVGIGIFYVKTNNRDSLLKVNYVSPYLNGGNSGFIAIPEIGARVLICKPDNDNEWYYLGTTSVPGLGNSLVKNTDPNNTRLPDSRVYLASGRPQRYVFKSPLGNMLVLSDEKSESYYNVKAELKSPSGKGLKLIDSPNIDCVILENEHGDKIKITSKANEANAPRSIEIEAKGPVNIVSRDSALNLTVIDGKELNITNKSTGSKRSGPNDPTPGNINVVTDNGDVNILAKGSDSSVFIEAQGSSSRIVLKSKGSIDLSADGNVNIAAGGDVKVTGSKIFLN
jgi:hypothetical protein